MIFQVAVTAADYAGKLSPKYVASLQGITFAAHYCFGKRTLLHGLFLLLLRKFCNGFIERSQGGVITFYPFVLIDSVCIQFLVMCAVMTKKTHKKGEKRQFR